MGALLQDIRYAVRILAAKPGFTAAAALVLALGLGANTAIFNLLHAILLRPLPGVELPERLVLIGRTWQKQGFDSLSYPDYLDYRQRNEVFSGVAAGAHGVFNLNAAGETVRASGAVVSANYFDVLRAKPSLGRTFQPSEEAARGGGAVAVISHRLWRRLYASDTAVIGRMAIVNGRPLTIVGVAPSGFVGTDIREPAIDVWIPIGSPAQTRPAPDMRADRGWNWLTVIARLKPAVDVGQAAANVRAMHDQLKHDAASGIAVASYHALGGGGARQNTGTLLLALSIGAGMLLLVACANIAGLLLVQASTRSREIAVRVALGAGRGRLVRQFLAEGLVLSAVGCVASLLICSWSADLLLRLFPLSEGVAPALDLQPDLPLAAYALGMALLGSVAFSLVPALHASKPDLTSALRAGGTAAGSRGSRFRDVLAVVQVALSVLLLATAGLLARTLHAVQSIDPLMRTDKVLLASLDPALNGYGEAAAKRLYARLLERITGMPGVESASMARDVPFSNSGTSFGPLLGGGLSEGAGIQSDCNLVGPAYFRTLGIEVVRGRDVRASDNEGSPRVAIVNQTLARRFWPAEDPLGKPIRFAGQNELWTVVGVARDSRYRSATEPARPLLYLPALQFSSPAFADQLPDFTLHVRTSGSPLGVFDSLQRVAREMDPDLPLYNVRSLRSQLDSSFWYWRVAAALSAILSLLAMAMATVGLYAVIACRVSHREQEMGLRAALGATPRQIIGVTLRDGMRLAASGLVAGILLALVAARLVSSFLYGVTPADPLTYVGVSLLLLMTALAACWIPAQRAAKLDPVVALRKE